VTEIFLRHTRPLAALCEVKTGDDVGVHDNDTHPAEAIMWEFFKEGGWPMWSILFIGFFLIGASIRFAVKPHAAKKELLKYLSFATIAAIVQGLVMDLGMVFGYTANTENVPDAQLERILLEGFHESTRPVTFGGGILVIALVLMAIGSSRLARKENPDA